MTPSAQRHAPVSSAAVSRDVGHGLVSEGLEIRPSKGALIAWGVLDSPVGDLVLTSDGTSLAGLHFADGKRQTLAHIDAERDDGFFDPVAEQLHQYFEQRRTGFDLGVAPVGTAFQLEVWRALTTIRYGETASYVDMARKLGRPNAYRALGNANGRNPVALIIPCHRVIANDGSLGGYGGGLVRKRLLLDLEGAGFTG